MYTLWNTLEQSAFRVKLRYTLYYLYNFYLQNVLVAIKTHITTEDIYLPGKYPKDNVYCAGIKLYVSQTYDFDK